MTDNEVKQMAIEVASMMSARKKIRAAGKLWGTAREPEEFREAAKLWLAGATILAGGHEYDETLSIGDLITTALDSLEAGMPFPLVQYQHKSPSEKSMGTLAQAQARAIVAVDLLHENGWSVKNAIQEVSSYNGMDPDELARKRSGITDGRGSYKEVRDLYPIFLAQRRAMLEFAERCDLFCDSEVVRLRVLAGLEIDRQFLNHAPKTGSKKNT